MGGHVSLFFCREIPPSSLLSFCLPVSLLYHGSNQTNSSKSTRGKRTKENVEVSTQQRSSMSVQLLLFQPTRTGYQDQSEDSTFTNLGWEMVESVECELKSACSYILSSFEHP